MKKKIKAYIMLIIIAAIIIISDQLTKNMVRNNLVYGEVWTPWEWLSPYARIVHWYNTGVAFGLFQGNSVFFKILSSFIALLIFVFYLNISGDDILMRIALSLEFGGAVGNLIDRFTVGHVTDFVSVGNFPVFNIADSAITIGVGFMILSLILENKKSMQEVKP